MRGLARLPAAVALAFLLLCSAPPAGAVNLLPGEPAPEFSLPDNDGKTVTLSQFRDRTVLIAFWSTWCWPGPAMGQDNDRVLRGLLGLTDAEYHALVADGVID